MISYHNDTICAISSPPGQGAIAVIRISGTEAISVADKVFKYKGQLRNESPNTLHFGKIIIQNQTIDDVVVGLFKAPRSYSGEDTVEISCHGSLFIQQKILSGLIDAGARMATPGEFTLRAFLNGKLDLSQAEGVADLIASGSSASHRLAYNQMRGGFSKEIMKLRQQLLDFISLIELELDFSEEDVEFADRDSLMELILKINKIIKGLIDSFEYGNAMKSGIPVAIIGRTNAGKSTLLNKLLREEKAIVSDIHGTTRDYIEDTMTLEGIQFRFIDTAGLRHTTHEIEAQGIERTVLKFKQAALVLVLIDLQDNPEDMDASLQFIRDEDTSGKQFIFVLNKTDLLSTDTLKKRKEIYLGHWNDMGDFAEISAKKEIGIKSLELLLVALANNMKSSETDVTVTNARHYEALKHTSEALERVLEGIENEIPTDLFAIDIRAGLHYLGEITGEIATDEILGNIFKNFCIGK